MRPPLSLSHFRRPFPPFHSPPPPPPLPSLISLSISLFRYPCHPPLMCPSRGRPGGDGGRGAGRMAGGRQGILPHPALRHLSLPQPYSLSLLFLSPALSLPTIPPFPALPSLLPLHLYPSPFQVPSFVPLFVTHVLPALLFLPLIIPSPELSLSPSLYSYSL